MDSKPRFIPGTRLLVVVFVLGGLVTLLHSAPALAVLLSIPQQYEVFQRSSAGLGPIFVQGTCAATTSSVAIQVSDPSGNVIGQAQLPASGGVFQGSLTVPAGGWYTVSASEGTNGPATTVPTVGVGEVFIVSGQSNAVHTAEAPQPTGPLVSVGNMSFDANEGSPAISWNKEVDPGTPYVVDYKHFGSAWASFATELSQSVGVPVSVIPMGCGGTRISQWLPAQSQSSPPDIAPGCATSAVDWMSLPSTPGNLYRLLQATAQTLNKVGSFRAVLWHQGESDAFNIYEHLYFPKYAVPGAVTDRYGYDAALTTIVQQLNSDLGMTVPWVIANASYFPSTDVNGPANCVPTGQGIPGAVQQAMNEVVAGQNLAIQQKVAYQGPDTDILVDAPMRYEGSYDGQNYGSCIHFSRLGAAMHGAYWSGAVIRTGLVPLGPPPQGGTQPLTLVSASSNDQLQGWPAASSVTAGSSTDYSSNVFPSWDNSRMTYLAAWLPQGSWVSEVDLNARMTGGRALGFPTFYDIYLTSPDNTSWTYVGQYGAQPDNSGVARIPLVESFYTYGVMVVPRALGVDNNGNYYFQLAGVQLLQ